MEQTAVTHDPHPFERIENFRQKIEPTPRIIDESDRLDYSRRKQGYIRRPKLNLGEATEVSAEAIWEVERDASPEVVRLASKAQMDYTWAIYCSVYGLTPKKAMMSYLHIDENSLEGQLLETMEQLEKVTSDYLEKATEADGFLAQVKQLETEVKALSGGAKDLGQVQLALLVAENNQLKLQLAAAAKPSPEVKPVKNLTLLGKEQAADLQKALEDLMQHVRPEAREPKYIECFMQSLIEQAALSI